MFFEYAATCHTEVTLLKLYNCYKKDPKVHFSSSSKILSLTSLNFQNQNISLSLFQLVGNELNSISHPHYLTFEPRFGFWIVTKLHHVSQQGCGKLEIID